MHQVNFGGTDHDDNQPSRSDNDSDFWEESYLGASDYSSCITPAESRQKLIEST